MQIVTRGVAALALGLALAVPSAAAGRSAAETVLAIAGTDRRELRLVELHRGTLAPTGRRLDARGHQGAWSYSPDRTRLALANSYVPTLGRPAGILLVDVQRVRALKRILVPGELGYMRALTWVAPGRLIALVVPNPTGSTLALAIDVARGRVVGRARVSGVVIGGQSLASGLVLLTAPASGIGQARLVTVDAQLRVRTVTLPGIRAGWRSTGEGEEYTVTQRRPGIAVDDLGTTAFVIGADEPPASVDLSTLEVVSHPVPRTMEARAKSMTGPVRFAAWLGDGMVGVSGVEYDGLDPKTGRFRQRPAGLTLLDTRTWAVTMVDEQADAFSVVGSTAVVDGHGLAAYAPDGRPLWTALAGRPVQVYATLGERVYAQLAGERGLRIFDVRSGRELGRRLGPIPNLLTARASRIW